MTEQECSEHIHNPVYTTVYTDTSADIQRSDSVMKARTGYDHCMYELDGSGEDLTIPRREATIQQK
ncbi:hypothetical protein Plhal304r1_c035g0108001 [Plasmopara halstedii]